MLKLLIKSMHNSIMVTQQWLEVLARRMPLTSFRTLVRRTISRPLTLYTTPNKQTFLLPISFMPLVRNLLLYLSAFRTFVKHTL